MRTFTEIRPLRKKGVFKWKELFIIPTESMADRHDKGSFSIIPDDTNLGVPGDENTGIGILKH
jgi:hypothetical protein